MGGGLGSVCPFFNSHHILLVCQGYMPIPSLVISLLNILTIVLIYSISRGCGGHISSLRITSKGGMVVIIIVIATIDE